MTKFITSFFAMRRDRLQRQAQQEVPEDIRLHIYSMFSTNSGQKVAGWLIEGFIVASSYVPGKLGGKCCDTAYQCGQHDLAMTLLDERDMFDQKRQEVAETK